MSNRLLVAAAFCVLAAGVAQAWVVVYPPQISDMSTLLQFVAGSIGPEQHINNVMLVQRQSVSQGGVKYSLSLRVTEGETAKMLQVVVSRGSAGPWTMEKISPSNDVLPCSDGSDPLSCPSDACSTAACGQNGVCLADQCGVCAERCTCSSDADCSGGLRCLPTLSQGGILTCLRPSCKSDSDCSETEWCRITDDMNVRECVPYKVEFESCGAFNLPQYETRCNEDIYTCFKIHADDIPDLPGQCLRKCSSSTPCPTGRFCGVDGFCLMSDSDTLNCAKDVDCVNPRNTWIHDQCVGYAACEGGACAWICNADSVQEPEEPRRSARASVAGGWKDVDMESAQVRKVVDFCLNRLNEMSNSIELNTLHAMVKAESQVVAGINYRITLETLRGDDNPAETHQFVVWAQLDGSLQLTNHLLVSSRTLPPCELPLKNPACTRAVVVPRYFFDRATFSCQPFSWNSCASNANNFADAASCADVCVSSS